MSHCSLIKLCQACLISNIWNRPIYCQQVKIYVAIIIKTVLLGIVFVAVDESLYYDIQYTLLSSKKYLLYRVYTSCKTLKIPIFVYTVVYVMIVTIPSWSSRYVSQVSKSCRKALYNHCITSLFTSLYILVRFKSRLIFYFSCVVWTLKLRVV